MSGTIRKLIVPREVTLAGRSAGKSNWQTNEFGTRLISCQRAFKRSVNAALAHHHTDILNACIADPCRFVLVRESISQNRAGGILGVGRCEFSSQHGLPWPGLPQVNLRCTSGKLCWRQEPTTMHMKQPSSELIRAWPGFFSRWGVPAASGSQPM